MRNKNVMILLFSACCFVSCVDSKYDLGKVESDGLTIGEGWEAPLGKGSVSTEDVVDINKVPSIQVKDGIYTIEYSGELETTKLDLRATGIPMITIASGDISTGEMDGLFDGNFKLAVADPRLTLENVNLESGSLDCQLEVRGENSQNTVSTFSDFTLDPMTENIWVGPIDPNKQQYTFVKNEELPNVIAIVPNTISLILKADPTQWAGLTYGDLEVLKYKVEIPFIPAKEFYAESSELIKDAFSEDLVDRIFNSGSVTIYGTVKNEMPFDLEVGMTILDQNMQNVGIALEKNAVNGAEGAVKFEFKGDDLAKMKNAKHIQMDLYLSGREKNEPLKPNQKVSLDLKLKKTGGITI